jgi:hypothetical protein
VIYCIRPITDDGPRSVLFTLHCVQRPLCQCDTFDCRFANGTGKFTLSNQFTVNTRIAAAIFSNQTERKRLMKWYVQRIRMYERSAPYALFHSDRLYTLTIDDHIGRLHSFARMFERINWTNLLRPFHKGHNETNRHPYRRPLLFIYL